MIEKIYKNFIWWGSMSRYDFSEELRFVSKTRILQNEVNSFSFFHKK